ncbi:MAG: response regulator [bacterium]|nr:response regulator [bacterium]
MAEANNKKVLVVEDDEALLSVMADSFTIEGFTVFSAANGASGLELALKEHPDIILLDIQMPVMDGLEMLDKLRQDDWGGRAEVILLTNFSDMDKVAKAAEKGAYDYLVKSDWKTEDIIKKVKNKLGLAEARAAIDVN